MNNEFLTSATGGRVQRRRRIGLIEAITRRWISDDRAAHLTVGALSTTRNVRAAHEFRVRSQ